MLGVMVYTLAVVAVALFMVKLCLALYAALDFLSRLSGMRRSIKAHLLASSSVQHVDAQFTHDLLEISKSAKDEVDFRAVKEIDRMYAKERAKVFPNADEWGGLVKVNNGKVYVADEVLQQWVKGGLEQVDGLPRR